LAKLLDEGRLKPHCVTAEICFHDPCYLGWQNGVYEAPRKVLQALSPKALLEMPRNRGGMSFIEEPANKRVSQARAAEALATGAGTLAVACPFCMAMMEDAANAQKGDRAYPSEQRTLFLLRV